MGDLMLSEAPTTKVEADPRQLDPIPEGVGRQRESVA
jgi:hypothetical protein